MCTLIAYVLDKMSPEQLSAYNTALYYRYRHQDDHRGYRVTGRPADHADEFPALQSDNHSDAKQRIVLRIAFSSGAYSSLALGGISAILLRWRTNGLLELFDSLRCRRF